MARQISRETLIALMGEIYWHGYNAALADVEEPTDDRKQVDRMLKSHRLETLSDQEFDDLFKV
jgi:hypothetical protein